MKESICCGLAGGEVAAEVVAEDDGSIAFRDLHPLAAKVANPHGRIIGGSPSGGMA